MKIDFLYSTDFLAMNAPGLGHTCMHLLCRAGEGSFVFNERCYHIVKNDLVVLPNPTRAKNLAAAPGMEVEWFAADEKYLHSLLPSNNYSIGGSISLNQNPVIKVDDRQAEILLEDIQRLRDRLDDRHLLFYREMMGSLCLTMMYDIFELHRHHCSSADRHARHRHQPHRARRQLLCRATQCIDQVPLRHRQACHRSQRQQLHRPRHGAHPEEIPQRRAPVAHADSRPDELHLAELFQPLLHQAPRPVAQRREDDAAALCLRQFRSNKFL